MLASWAFSGNRCRGFPHLCWPALIGLLSVYHAAHAGLRAHAAATGEQPALTVTACNIEATFHVREKTLAAQAAIVLKASGPVTAVPLELNPLLTLEAAELDGHPLQVIRSRTPASARLLVVLPQPRTGSFSLTFRYHGSLRLPANSADYWTDRGLLLTDDSRCIPCSTRGHLRRTAWNCASLPASSPSLPEPRSAGSPQMRPPLSGRPKRRCPHALLPSSLPHRPAAAATLLRISNSVSRFRRRIFSPKRDRDCSTCSPATGTGSDGRF